MAMFDKLKEATRPTNTIEAVQQQRPGDLHSASPAPAIDTSQQPPKRPTGDAKAAAYTMEPDAIARAYYVENHGSERRYFDDYQRKALAIRATDTSINSKREDLNTIRAMLTMAEARGWSEVKVNGSAEFKRETWIEAAARGITAQGYKAGDLDRQEADRRRAERGQGQSQARPDAGTNEVRQAPPSPATASPTQQGAAVSGSLKPASPSPVAAPTIPAPVQAAPAKGDDNKQQVAAASAKQDATPSRADHRQVLKEATAELSPDGRLMLSAVAEKIDRQMNKLNNDGKAEMKAYFATELVKKEKAEGPVVLSAELKRIATAPEPAPEQKPAAPVPGVVQGRDAPQEPRRTRSR